MSRAFHGLATGIGSLPFSDPQTAVDTVLTHCPELPFWPQLPKRHPHEGMLAQFMEGFPAGDGTGLEEFYAHIIDGDSGYFKVSEGYAAGLYAFKKTLHDNPALLHKIQSIKCHITGPFTTAAGINGPDGKPLLYDHAFFQAFVKGLAMKALWQVEFFREFGKPRIVFIDEPYLGCFGSAFTPLNREDALAGLGELTAAIASEEVLTGVHCCGNTDWSIFTETPRLDIINFDAYNYSENLLLYAAELKKFLGRGGILCWGIVPTQELPAGSTAQALAAKVSAGVDVLVKKGIDRQLVQRQMMISPACGLGTRTPEAAEEALRLLHETSLILQEASHG